MRTSLLLLLIVVGVALVGPPQLQDAALASGHPQLVESVEDEHVDFARDVRPLLSDRCFACHGPDERQREGNLRLDQAADMLRDRDGYAVVVPGEAAESELVRRIEHHGQRGQMPPKASKLSLSTEEIQLLRRWISEGATMGQHWSFLPPIRREPPRVKNPTWARDPLDAFVLAELERAGLEPAPTADPATLLRRVSLDLTGLPPTRGELADFLADPSEEAYASVVEGLLASPAHAERMTAEWLDVARYADTFGYQSDVEMHVWPWRDWVLNAFLSNLPYDEFITHQLAGDLLPYASRETRLATAFNRLHRQTNEGGSVEEEFRQSYVADRVETLGSAVLGLTLGCARCHDHKFDPISQRDFYELASFFDDIDESGLYSHFTNAVPTPALDLPTPEQEQQLDSFPKKLRTAREALEDCVARPGQGRPAQGRYAFESPEVTANGIAQGPAAQLSGGPLSVPGAQGQGLELSGENAIALPGVGVFHRSDPFSIGLHIYLPRSYERAVVLHRSKAWTDSGSRGYQLLVEGGCLSVALVHFWPGDALALRTTEPVELQQWLHVAFTYDGSSRAEGLRIYLNGELAQTEVLRDSLTRTIRGGSIGHLTLGSRFRDNGFAGGRVDELAVFDRELSAREIRSLARSGELPLLEPDGEADLAGEALRALRVERDGVVDSVRQIMTMRTVPDLPAAQRTMHLLERGDYRSPGPAVQPALLDAFPSLGVATPGNRLDLARWLLHPEHPTTARVQVDRLFRIVFAQGLVPAPEDFGSQSPPPLHLELLDTLARDYIESGWDSRALLRRLVTSATYRQSAHASVRALELDPENQRISRANSGPRSAEMVRDGALHAAGLLAPRWGGPSVYPYQPPGLWQQKSGRTYPLSRGADLRRRSLYTFWKRTSPPPTLSAFGAPSREVCTVERPRTVTPQQSLALWNDPQFVAVAASLGRLCVREAKSTEDRIQLLSESLLSRSATADELAVLGSLWADQHASYSVDLEAARALAGFELEAAIRPEEAGDPGEVQGKIADIATATVVASTLLSLDSALSRR